MLNSHQRSPAVLGCGIQRYNISVNVLGISELADAYPTRPFDNMQTGSLIALFGIMEGNEDHIRKKHEFSLNFQNLSCPSELRFQTVCRGSESKKASGSFNDEFVTVHGVCSVAQIMVGHVDFFFFFCCLERVKSSISGFVVGKNRGYAWSQSYARRIRRIDGQEEAQLEGPEWAKSVG